MIVSRATEMSDRNNHYDNDVLVNPFIDDTLASKNNKTSGYFSQDIDNDGVIEIPLTSPFTGYIGTSSAKTHKQH